MALKTARSQFEKEFEKYIDDFNIMETKELADKVRQLCGIYGILFVSKIDYKLNHHIPITVFPSPFPKEHFEKVRALQPEVNMLIHKVSNDYEFIINGLKSVGKADIFTKKIVAILKKLRNYRFPQQIQVGIIRSDYMIDDLRKTPEQVPKIYLVEYNTISVSFGAHGSQIQSVHSDVMQHAGGMRVKQPPKIIVDEGKNKITEDIGLALSSGWHEYRKKYNAPSSCMLFIIQKNERNIFDHCKIERSTLKLIKANYDKQEGKKKLPVIFYVTFEELFGCIKVNESDGALIYTHPASNLSAEVALAYYRSGYTPDDYKSENCWDVRTMLELSRAIKVPTISQQLSGTKKIQQLLYSEKTLEKYLPKEVAKAIHDTFTGIYPLDLPHPESDKLLRMIKSNPENYVLKPQREGGGNNIYGKDILVTLNDLTAKNQPLSAYILMDMIHPTVYKNYFVLPDKNQEVKCDCVGELGVWGVYVVNDSNMICNISSGHIYRSKNVSELDGGVASGRAVLDSVCLY
ncbi:hypothetical protein MXB_4391 [Myxobolus squamalis]|nr:hypothetical protein MXB_4391 [Myxobolus squamalis]